MRMISWRVSAARSKVSRAIKALVLLGFAGCVTNVHAGGVSPYLPLNLSPDIERKIERVLILGGESVLRRPIAAAVVLRALPKACRRDARLCEQVREYLGKYMHTAGITSARIGIAASHGNGDEIVPNEHGLTVGSRWDVSLSGYYQPGDHVLLNAGVVSNENRTTPTGTMVSLGFDVAQLDLGYRDHWLSPFTDSSMLIGTEAPTMPSITLSNYVPLTSLGIGYEVFLAQMSRSDHIVYQDHLTAGHPRLAGLQLQIEPVSGYAIGINRLMQYGGGERRGNSARDFLDALFNPHGYDNTGASLNADNQFGNQQASLTSRILFPGKRPFAFYVEYAGEDTSYGQNYLLGNTALSIGIDLPHVGNRFDVTLEASEWQNGWYVHGVYLDGMTNHGVVIGHWFGDQRVFNDGVGGQSQMVRVGWEARDGGYLQSTFRTLKNDTAYAAAVYRRMYEMDLRYSRVWLGRNVSAGVYAGRDVFGGDFAGLRGAIDFARVGQAHDVYASVDADDEAVTQLFADVGMNYSRVSADLGDGPYDAWPHVGNTTRPHLAIGARRAVTEHSDLGARLEWDSVLGHDLFSIRALDYRYRIGKKLALSGFFGVGRYENGLPAYGFYLGLGTQWRDVLPRWDLSLDVRHHEKIARDKLLAGDPPQVSRPDEFFRMDSLTAYLSRRF